MMCRCMHFDYSLCEVMLDANSNAMHQNAAGKRTRTRTQTNFELSCSKELESCSKDRCQNSFQHQACVHTTKQECVMWLDHNIDPYIVKVSVLNHQHFELP